ncbi:serine/threonine protein kinase [Streptomyces roseoverticillatus]|uniref:serine/threonine-protein kinase n=1 Tax=Streptomyces roseoverticillatus TaxID=66429 RepID=UPI001F308B31|nr:serine/threonine-protein kinase [Streptomyces roseoverticillatus]MCF3100014.1 serine/threonine protein kinase [Streptomyces roseoverticillatus]
MDSLRPDDPHTLGAYRLLGRLGAGGMGRVYLARSDRGRTVAVKLVHRELAGQEEFRRRFRQEVRSARQVGGEWTAPVLDADTEAEVPWVATGYIAGPSLRQVVDRDFGPLPERSVRILGAGLARALQAVHAAGIVHRDLKPSNVLVTLDGPRVIDFGIARALETVTDGDGLTRTGAAVGSPGFMSPEQVRGGAVTPASDVFCLGSVLAYAATGRMPFGTADSGVHALMYRIAEEQPDLTGVPAGLRPLITSFLAKDPQERPTPAQVLEVTGVEEVIGDLRSAEPWLPAGLVAQLGRHAVQLLDVEEPVRNPAPASDGHAPTAISPAAAPLSPAQPRPPVRQDPPTVTAGNTPPPAPHPSQPLPPPAPAPAPYGYPQQGPYGHAPGPHDSGSTYVTGYVPYGPPAPRRSRTPLILAAVVAAGLIAGGGTVFLLKQNGAKDHASGATSSSSQAASPGTSSPSSAPAGGSTPAPATSPGTGADAGTTGPQAFAGTWQSGFGGGSRTNNRAITITRGTTAAVTIDGSGVLDDGTPYTCQWQTTATGGGTAGTPLHLGPSLVTHANPASACQPGSASDLVLLPDGRMRRDFVDSGTKDASLVYRKTG